MGPEGFQARDVYLRTATSVDAQGWAHFGYVKMPDYRWGIFLAEPEPDRTIGFGDHNGQPAWQDVPGEYRATLRRIIVTQGDTEPASVEQQRQLGLTCPSLYDLRNLFQVNVEEGRHLWAMVYLLHALLRPRRPRGGRGAARSAARATRQPAHPRRVQRADAGLARRSSCSPTSPTATASSSSRALAESGFDPLARTCRFMLTEEAHHMFVGETGVARVVQRTCEVMKEHRRPTTSARPAPSTCRRSSATSTSTTRVTLDLFGADDLDATPPSSTPPGSRAASRRASRPTTTCSARRPTRSPQSTAAARDARGAGACRAQRAAARRLHQGFQRRRRPLEPGDREARARRRLPAAAQGLSPQDRRARPSARVARTAASSSEAEWDARRAEWLPTPEDHAFVAEPDGPVVEPGKFASWIAPPARGINGKPVDFEYVRS